MPPRKHHPFLLLLLTLYQLPAQDFVVERNIAVPMRDGVALATDLYFPAANGVRKPGTLPVILERTPYDKSRVNGELYASRGYVYVVQDTRVRYSSEGRWAFLTGDDEDGHDAPAWIVKQPWSNGLIGTIGTSYGGGTQHALALGNAPGLAALIPVDAVSNAGSFGIRNSGAFELRFFNWIFTIGAPRGSRASRDPATRAALAEMAKNTRQYLDQFPIRKGVTPLKFAPEYEDWLIEAITHSDNDAYWKQPDFGVADQAAQYKDVPVLVVGGWYDSWARSTTTTYEALSKAKKSPVKLIMGPWIHGRQTAHAHGQVEFGETAAFQADWRLRWYDRWLKKEANGAEKDPAVRIFVMGGGTGTRNAEGKLVHGGQWRGEREWPLARARATPYYLHAGGTLSTTAPAPTGGATSYDFDPRLPVPTIGGSISSGDGILLQGARDQKCGTHVWNCRDELPLSARRDVLVFQTAPLAEDMEVTGPIDVKLWVASSAADTDFTTKLIDVYPPTEACPEDSISTSPTAFSAAAVATRSKRRSCWRPASPTNSPCGCTRRRTCSRKATVSALTCRRATTRALTSIPTQANRWANTAACRRPSTACSMNRRGHLILLFLSSPADRDQAPASSSARLTSASRWISPRRMRVSISATKPPNRSGTVTTKNDSVAKPVASALE